MALLPSSVAWRTRTLGGIPFRVIKRTGSISFEDGNVTETIIIRSNRLLDFLEEGFPYPVVFGNQITYPPQPVHFGTGLVPKEISWEGLTGDLPIDPFGSDPLAPLETYDTDLKVTIEYGPTVENNEPADENDASTFLQISANAASVFWSVPGEPEAQWVEGGGNEDIKEVNIPNTITEANVEWTIRWTRIDSTFFSDIVMERLRNKLGKVNNEPMPLLKGAPINTVLFLTWSMSQQLTWREGRAGKPPLQLEMKFLEKNFESVELVDVTHQHVYRPGHGWRELLINGNPLFADTDLNGIWE